MSEQNVKIVRDVYGSFAAGDVDAVFTAMTPDIEWDEAEGMPYGGVYHGRDAIVSNVIGPILADVEGFIWVSSASRSQAPVSVQNSAAASHQHPGRPAAPLSLSQPSVPVSWVPPHDANVGHRFSMTTNTKSTAAKTPVATIPGMSSET
jgi:hypothetical protein